ncbi:MAG: 3-dehydroquinate synthase [Cytophagales bacterium]|nr:MAG: 3-dehydroquinate synthase [Cytophagales bacterium]
MTEASEILFTLSIADTLNNYLAKQSFSRLVVLVDENTEKHCLPIIKEILHQPLIISIKSGEEHKTLQTCEIIWEKMTQAQLDRKALMINLGGGVIGDMGGFCAATYKRGIRFIQIPTTLLSQVDASVGGKLGIDFMGLKNHIGVFQTPLAVIIDTNFLQTLTKKEIKSGYAEIIKHCLIADAIKWNEIIATPYHQLDWFGLAQHSVVIKSKVTVSDPLEKGLRKILNFGHTIGHAIESHFLNIPNKRLLHGEAIAIGMIAESYLAFEKGFISKQDLSQITKYLLEIYQKVEIFDFDIEQILPIALQDKKNESNAIQCSLLEKIGKANYNIEISLKDIRNGLNYYNAQSLNTI